MLEPENNLSLHQSGHSSRLVPAQVTDGQSAGISRKLLYDETHESDILLRKQAALQAHGSDRMQQLRRQKAIQNSDELP